MARLRRGASVCALIPHYECEEWLGAAIASLVEQTRPVDAVVVIDDGSKVPPIATVERFPGVTLLRSTENVGPYRLAQAVIDATNFDAYLFQDADDWSARDRLEALLDVAVSSGAEMVGSQEVRLYVGTARTRPFRYPLDVNAALRQNPTAHSLQHPTSLISRELVRRIGGFATGLRFAADTEFVRRASYVARIRNADHFAYFRRQWPGSLTMAPDTGIRSRQRTALHDELSARAKANAAAVREGRAPELRPWSVGSTPQLELLAGPPLGRITPNRRRRQHVRTRASGGDPVFVVGAPRSGHVELAYALGQAAGFVSVPDRQWLFEAVRLIDETLDQQPTASSEQQAVITRTLGELLQPDHGRVVVALSAAAAPLPAMAERFSEAKFIHVVRDPDEVAASLAIAQMEEGILYSRDAAYRGWMRDFEIGLALEESVGRRAMRISHRRLWSSRSSSMSEVLEFLDCPNQASAVALTATNLFPRPRFRIDRPSSLQAVTAREMWRDHQRRRARSQRGQDIELLRTLLRGMALREPSDLPMVDRVKQLIKEATAQGSVVAIVSRGDDALVSLNGRTGWHFPQASEGYYAGFHPANSAEAISHLEHLRSLGATHFVIPATAFWWLDYYSELTTYLAAEARLVAFLETAGAVWDFVTPRAPLASYNQGTARIPALGLA